MELIAWSILVAVMVTILAVLFVAARRHQRRGRVIASRPVAREEAAWPTNDAA